MQFPTILLTFAEVCYFLLTVDVIIKSMVCKHPHLKPVLLKVILHLAVLSQGSMFRAY